MTKSLYMSSSGLLASFDQRAGVSSGCWLSQTKPTDGLSPPVGCYRQHLPLLHDDSPLADSRFIVPRKLDNYIHIVAQLIMSI